MEQLLQRRWFFRIAGGFVLLQLLLLYFEVYALVLLPFVLVILGLAFFSLDKLLLIIGFFVPLSVGLEQLDFGVGIIVPTEPLLAGILLLYVIKAYMQKGFHQPGWRHPISVAIYFYLGWMLITAFTSTDIMVSLKFFISRLWFIVPFYFLGIAFFQDKERLLQFLWLFLIGMCCVVIYTVISHAGYAFEKQPAHWVMQPFFKDHTSYGATLALVYPAILGLLSFKRYGLTAKVALGIIFIIITIGLILSYTRAAWVSLVAAFAVYALMKLRIKFSTVAMVVGAMLLVLASFQTEILQSLEQNRQDSSGDIGEHVQSISNVSTDASNLERINRWSCAWRMFLEKPVFGFGPGTYMFEYAPFQYSGDLNIVSTNFGNRGNAHSEYLGPLSESGLLGMLSIMLIIGLVCYFAIIYWGRLTDYEDKTIVMMLFLGLLTYFVHGLLNNFLDMDKIAIPFWGFIAAIVGFGLGKVEEAG